MSAALLRRSGPASARRPSRPRTRRRGACAPRADGNATTRRTGGEWADASGCGESLDYEGGKTTGFTFDELGQEKTMRVDPAGEGELRRFETTWHPSGDVATRTKPNGTLETYYYDTDGPESARVRDPEGAGLETDVERYQFDQNQNWT